ncbi:MAG: hypothetical protein DRP56_06775 [Planctomycetota bacterium]|nr:MAG: hypothetical protein DRP56_06775 [Planctomycetota bacterium]
MKKLMLALMIFFVCGLAFADTHVVGPYPNYKGTVETGLVIELPTTADFYINDPFGGEYHVAGRGGQVVQANETYDLPVFALSYVEFWSEEGIPFDPETDDIILTEIWAYDEEPGLEPNQVPSCVGFWDYQFITPLVDGSVTGRSGVQYWDAVETLDWTALQALGAAGYDVSKIDFSMHGDRVYMTQFTVPADEFIIEEPSPYFLVDANDQWQSKLDEEWPDMHIRGLTQEEGDAYLQDLNDLLVEGIPYSPIAPESPMFVPPQLYVFDGNETNPDEPNDAGLVMVWGEHDPQNPLTPPDERASAWAWDYGDPDLSNCIIKVTASPPGSSGINRISLGMQDINGNIRSWWWNVPSVIGNSPPGLGTTIKIDTTMTGLSAATPTASGFANSAAFDLTKVASIVADENANWVSSVLMPPPGGTINAIWNYWHNLSVTPKLPSGGANSKWFVKYSQPPVEVEGEPGQIIGWDEVSMTKRLPNDPNTPVMADDWKCKDERPITDIHWWGSFIGWTQPHLPPIVPSGFHIGIWTDVPDLDENDPCYWSHPGELIWENECKTAVWNFAGYDVDPRIGDPCEQENETCFQWAQFLNQDEWFYQEPNETTGENIYWLSIAAVYDASVDFEDPDFYPWGWKTRKHFYNDDAVRVKFTSGAIWPPELGSIVNMTMCEPVEWPQGISWDLAFELTTNDGLAADLNNDGIVNLPDFAIMADDWLKTSP